MKKTSKTKFVILGLLTIKPLSGYEIRKFICNTISHFWAESNGQIYPTLKQLVENKWIIFNENPSTTKKFCNRYSITSEGLRQLEKWLQVCVEKDVSRDEGLLKLFFGGNASVEESIRRLREREESVIKALKTYHGIKDEIEEERDSPHALYWELTLQNGIAMAKAELSWCRQSIKRLETIER